MRMEISTSNINGKGQSKHILVKTPQTSGNSSQRPWIWEINRIAVSYTHTNCTKTTDLKICANLNLPFPYVNHVKNPKPETAWFKNTPMGVNLLYSLIKYMKNQCPAIQSSKKITNHRVRKHLMQKCNDLGLAPTHAIQISGHKKVASTNNYSRLNQQQQKSISSAIFNTGKSHTITERPPPSATVTSPVPEVLPDSPYRVTDSPPGRRWNCAEFSQISHKCFSSLSTEPNTPNLHPAG